MKKFIISILLTLTAVALVACGPYALSPQERDTAELGAVKYSQADSATFLSCSGQDSDSDGYVTCSIKTKEAVVVPLVCSYNAQGCKSK